MYFRPHVLIILILLACGLDLSGQQQSRRVEILNANSLEYDAALGQGVRRLIGDVRLKHEEVIMISDSAHVHDNENMVFAYGNVNFNQGDTIQLFGDYVEYSSRTKLALARGNVKLVDNETTLNTTELDFDMNKNLAIYRKGAVIQNADSKLESRRGYYYTKLKTFYFAKDITITHPDYTIFSDSLKYNTQTEIADFFGPTTITSDDGYSYAEAGWFNQKTNRLEFTKNAYIVNESQILSADTIFYDREIDFGRAFSNIEVTDTIEKVILKGNYGLFYRNPEWMMITGRAQFIQVTDGDSLFLHADTLRSYIPEGEEHRILKAYYGARFFKSDIQGKCDSLVYNFRDSIIHMYVQPVLWFEESQLTSETIHVYTKNRKMDYMHMPSQAFMVSDEGNERFNQVKGREMFGYFREGKLDHFHVIGNVETIYYLKEEKANGLEELIGVNKASSQQLIIRVKDNKPDEIVFITKPEGTLYPPDYLEPTELRLQEFTWLEEIRPKDRNDIFRR